MRVIGRGGSAEANAEDGAHVRIFGGENGGHDRGD